MTSSKRPRNPRGEGGRLRDEIIDAAVALIDASPAPPTLSLRGIAREAGISAPSIYDHFPNAEAVVDAVLGRSFEALRARIQAAAETQVDDPVDALIAVGRAYVEFAWSHRTRYLLMFDAGGYASNAIESFAIVRDLIAQCAAAGLSASTDPHLDAWMLWAGLHGVATLQKPSRTEQLRLGPLDRPAMLEVIIRRLARLPDGDASPR